MHVVKRISSISLIVLLLVAVSFSGQLHCNVVFAAESGEWVNVSSNEQYEAFLAYCKSRKVTIGGSVIDAATVVTTELYQNAVSTLGIDLNALQAALWKYQENNVTVKWGFQYLGITAFNNILANILQNYDIEVGDENVDVTVRSGRWFQDLDGHGCWVYEVTGINNVNNTLGNTGSSLRINSYGSSYIYDYSSIVGRFPNSFSSDIVHVTSYYNTHLNFTYNNNSESSSSYYYRRWYAFNYDSENFSSDIYEIWPNNTANNSNTINGSPCVVHVSGASSIALGAYYKQKNNREYIRIHHVLVDTVPPTDTTVDITSPKVEPPLEPPGGDDMTVINPDGTIDEPEPEAPEPGGNIPDWTIPDSDVTPDGDGGFNFDWNFQLPDLNIDWSIEGLKDKFPFSIPFDLYDLVCILDAEPKTPEFETTIDFIVYEWDLDLDLHQFDNIAAIVRNLEFIGFLFGLILITRKIIKG